MKTPGWLKPALIGAFAGAVVLFVLGFSIGGWMSAGEAKQLADERARTEVMAVTLPFCTEHATDPGQGSLTYARMKEAPYHERAQIAMDAGWATLPGKTEPDATLAVACVKSLEF